MDTWNAVWNAVWNAKKITLVCHMFIFVLCWDVVGDKTRGHLPSTCLDIWSLFCHYNSSPFVFHTCLVFFRLFIMTKSWQWLRTGIRTLTTFNCGFKLRIQKVSTIRLCCGYSRKHLPRTKSHLLDFCCTIFNFSKLVIIILITLAFTMKGFIWLPIVADALKNNLFSGQEMVSLNLTIVIFWCQG